MKGVFWNNDGFKDPKKHKFISDLTKEHNLSFIAISETSRKNFTSPFLKNLCAGRDFLWHVKEPRGRSGGILLGIDLNVYDIGAIVEGNHYVKFHLCNKMDGYKWALVVVYGPAQNNLKEQFLTELVNMCSHETSPTILGGDFNILRTPHDKNNDNYDNCWPFLFNVIIDGLNLRELEMSGRKYIWANSLPIPTYEKLDRILMATEWEQKFPLSTVIALSRDISDHTPLLLNTGGASPDSSQPMFKFELGWLLRDGFMYMVKKVWSEENKGYTPMEKWQAKMRRLRQFLRGWAKNVSGANKKKRKTYLMLLMRWIKKRNILFFLHMKLMLSNA